MFSFPSSTYTLLFWGCFTLFLGTVPIASSPGQTNDSTNEEMLTADILKLTLYAKTDEEKEYCEFVVKQRDEKVLPNKILYASYRYAMKKEKDRRFFYFEKSLETLCQREKISLNPPKTKKSPYFSYNKAATTPKLYLPQSNNPFSPIFRWFHRDHVAPKDTVPSLRASGQSR